MRGRTLGSLLILGAIGIALYVIFPLESDVDKINQRLDELSLVLAKNQGPKESILSAASKGLSAAEFCTEDVTVELLPELETIEKRSNLAAWIGRLRMYTDSARVTFLERDIKVDAGGKHAVVTLVGSVDARQGVRPRSYDYTYRLAWVKEEGTWFIQKSVIVSQ